MVFLDKYVYIGCVKHESGKLEYVFMGKDGCSEIFEMAPLKVVDKKNDIVYFFKEDGIELSYATIKKHPNKKDFLEDKLDELLEVSKRFNELALGEVALFNPLGIREYSPAHIYPQVKNQVVKINRVISYPECNYSGPYNPYHPKDTIEFDMPMLSKGPFHLSREDFIKATIPIESIHMGYKK